MSPTNPSLQYVIGVGASAGGVEALERLFKKVPKDLGAAFVVIQHLAPDFKSLMPEILARKTNLPIHTAEDGLTLEPNHIYLNIPRTSVEIKGGKLKLRPLDEENPTLFQPINIFFNSLAKELGSQAICIVLSGTGSDGTMGAVAVRELGGLVITQDSTSSKYQSMPENAAEIGPSDLVISPEEMPTAIASFIEFGMPTEATDVDTVVELSNFNNPSLNRLYELLLAEFGIDFRQYRPHTIERRIQRRMGIKQIKTLTDYVEVLEQNRGELDAIYRDVLLDVTHFFRDDEPFERLAESVIPSIINNKKEGETIRIWVAGCASGEEAYTMGILFLEAIQTSGKDLNVKIFATDAHPESILRAGRGVYTPDKVGAVADHLRNKYFHELEDGTFKVDGALRGSIIFAVHNLLIDAHFTKLDLVSCRNVLIYLKPSAQSRLFSKFYQGLILNGFLFLGSSEHLGGHESLYETIDRRLRIFKKVKESKEPFLAPSPMLVEPRSPFAIGPRKKVPITPQVERKIINSLILAGFVVDKQGQLIHMYGNVNQFLKFDEGEINLNLSGIVLDELATPLRLGLYRARESGKKVKINKVNVDIGGEKKLIDIEVSTLELNTITTSDSNFYFASLSSSPLDELPEDAVELDLPVDDQDKIKRLEHEIVVTQESLQAVIEELETTNEELQTSNEELIASNEELQSTNEELSAVNEELYSTNTEYQKQNEIYMQLNSDVINLMAASQVLVVLLDNDFSLRVVSPYAQNLFGFQENDIGRSILQFNLFSNLDPTDLEVLLQLAISGEVLTRRVFTHNHFPFTLRLSPYTSYDDSVTGVVLVWSDTYIDLDKIDSFFAKPASFQSLSADLPSCMFVFDLEQDRIVFSGGDLLSALGYPPTFKARHLKDVLHPEDKTDLDAVLQNEIRDLKDGEINRRTHLLRHENGEPVLCRVNEGVYGRSYDGTLNQTMIVVTPISDSLSSLSD